MSMATGPSTVSFVTHSCGDEEEMRRKEQFLSLPAAAINTNTQSTLFAKSACLQTSFFQVSTIGRKTTFNFDQIRPGPHLPGLDNF
jgi:hypothetical protein